MAQSADGIATGLELRSGGSRGPAPGIRFRIVSFENVSFRGTFSRRCQLFAACSKLSVVVHPAVWGTSTFPRTTPNRSVTILFTTMQNACRWPSTDHVLFHIFSSLGTSVPMIAVDASSLHVRLVEAEKGMVMMFVFGFCRLSPTRDIHRITASLIRPSDNS